MSNAFPAATLSSAQDLPCGAPLLPSTATSNTNPDNQRAAILLQNEMQSSPDRIDLYIYIYICVRCYWGVSIVWKPVSLNFPCIMPVTVDILMKIYFQLNPNTQQNLTQTVTNLLPCDVQIVWTLNEKNICENCFRYLHLVRLITTTPLTKTLSLATAAII